MKKEGEEEKNSRSKTENVLTNIHFRLNAFSNHHVLCFYFGLVIAVM